MTLSPLLSEIRALLAEADRAEPQLLSDLRQGRPGVLHYGSARAWFAVWDSLHGGLRDFSMHMMLSAIRLNRDPDFPRAAVPKAIATFLMPPARFLAQYGLPELPRWIEALGAADAADPEFDACLVALGRYANRLNSWIFHYFPWDVADHWQFTPPGHTAAPPPVQEGAADATGPAAVAPTEDLVTISFPTLGLSVRAWLSDANPALLADVKAAMPFTSFIDHASMAGDSMFSWTPILSTAATPVTERVCDAPVGRLRFSQNTGQKLTIQYGPIHESIRVAVLGAVLDADLPVLREVGARVRHATQVSKDVVWMTVAAA
jgi:hypothetical protein